MTKLLAEHKVPLLIHQPSYNQPSYNMLNRWIEKELLDELGVGSIAFTPLAQGLLTNKYLNGVPQDARVNKAGGGSLKQEHLSQENLAHVCKLNELAQMAWALRGGRVTSVLIGASRAEQVAENIAALKNLEFTKEELAEIDQYATEGNLNLWGKAVDGSAHLRTARAAPATGAASKKQRAAVRVFRDKHANRCYHAISAFFRDTARIDRRPDGRCHARSFQQTYAPTRRARLCRVSHSFSRAGCPTMIGLKLPIALGCPAAHPRFARSSGAPV